MKKNYVFFAVLYFLIVLSTSVASAKGPTPSNYGFTGYYFVTGSVVPAENGLYSYAGNSGGYLYFSLVGGNDNNTSYIIWDGYSQWQIGPGCCGGQLNYADCSVNSSDSLPPDTVWSCSNLKVKYTKSAVITNNPTLFESINDDGSIVGSANLQLFSLNNAVKFAGASAENFVQSNRIKVAGVPAGLTAQVIRTNDSLLTITFLGNATNNTHSSDGWVKLTLNDASFVGGDTIAVGGYQDSVDLNFRQVYKVASTGAPYTSIDTAANVAADFDVIQISGETFTEQINTTKALVYLGSGADKTVVQSASTPQTTSGSVFNINSTNPSVFIGITIQNGYMNNGGNAWGAAIFASNGGSLFLYDMRITNNEGISGSIYAGYGGAIFCGGSFTAYNSEFSNNTITNMAQNGQIWGGAISAQDSVTVVNCTFFADSAIGVGSQGGAIYAGGVVKAINSTFTKNFATSNGGALFCIADARIYNSIFYGDSTADNFEVEFGAFDTLHAYNSIIKSFGGPIVSFDTTMVLAVNPLLSSLANNGGTTQTCALSAGSPAIDGSLKANLTPTIDQRHYYQLNNRDIGAFEYGGLNCQPTFASNTATICYGKTYTVGKHQYSASATYTDTLHSVQGCDSIIQTQLWVLNQTKIKTIAVTADSCGGCNTGMITTSIDAASNYNLTWSDSTQSGYVTLQGRTADTLSHIPGGTYILQVTDSCNNTVADTIRVPRVIALGLSAVNDNGKANNFEVYPNPSNGAVTLNVIGTGAQRLVVYDITGKQQQAVVLNAAQPMQQFNVALNLPDGIYSVEMIYANSTQTKRLIIAH